MRQSLRNKLIATIGDRPVWIKALVALGSKRLDRPNRIHSVLWELQAMESLGLVVRLPGSLWMRGEGCLKKGKRRKA